MENAGTAPAEAVLSRVANTPDPVSAPESVPAILLIEDAIHEAYLLRLALKRTSPSPDLHHVMDGRAAIDFLKGVGRYTDRTAFPLPSVVILDLHLPGLHGLEVLAWIRSQPHFAQLPVFIFTASLNPKDRSKSEALGATGYLEKPSGFEALLGVAAALRSHAMGRRQVPVTPAA